MDIATIKPTTPNRPSEPIWLKFLALTKFHDGPYQRIEIFHSPFLYNVIVVYHGLPAGLG